MDLLLCVYVFDICDIILKNIFMVAFLAQNMKPYICILMLCQRLCKNFLLFYYLKEISIFHCGIKLCLVTKY